MAEEKETHVAEDEFALADAFNKAIAEQSPDGKVSLEEVLRASAAIAAAYLDQTEDKEEKNAEVEAFVSEVRAYIYPNGQPDLCLGCAFAEAINRKFPDGRTTASDRVVLDFLSRLSAQFLEEASEKGLETFFDLIRTHRRNAISGSSPSHLTH